MSRRIIEAADGSRHIIEVPDGPTAKPRTDTSFDDKIKADLKESGGYLANLGAGFDNVWQGAKQLVGQGDDDKVIEERRRIKQQLANSRTGGGATQLLGEVLGSAPLTGGVGGAVGKVATMLPKVASLAMKGGRIANLGTIGRGAVEGVAGGLLNETTSEESPTTNAGVSGVVGAAVPTVFAGANVLRKALNKGNAPNRAAALIEKQLGKEGLQEVEDALVSPTSQSHLPLSTAAKSQSTQLGALERGARNRSDWTYAHDRPVMSQAWSDLQGATRNADELPQRVADRETMMAASKKDLGFYDMPGPLGSAKQIMSDAADALRATPAGRQIPEVTKEISQVEQMLAHPDRSAEDYATAWFRLTEKIDKGEFGVDGTTVLRKLRDAVQQAGDVAGNVASGGGDTRLSDMLGRYMAEQGHVGQSEASKALRETFVSPQGVILKTREGLSSPEVRSGVLRQALAKHGENQYGNVLDPQTRAGVESLVKDMGRHEIHLPGNSPGATGLDINNPITVASSGRDNVVNYFPGLKGSLNWLFGHSREATTKQADQALMDPAHFQAILEGLRHSRTPLSSPSFGGPAFKPEDYADIVRRGLLRLPGRLSAAELGD